MSDVANYETDILLWSERQAELLRGLKGKARELPNELDLENVAEEIESVGRTEFRAAGSFLSLILKHAIKAAAYPTAEAVPHWLAEIRTFHGQYLSALTPAMRERFDLERLWSRARKDELENISDRGDALPGLPSPCPFALSDFDEDCFDARVVIDRLKGSIGPQTPSRNHPIQRPGR